MSETNIKFEGTPQTYETGAKRNSKEGKGRFDLIPSDIMVLILSSIKKLQSELLNIKCNTIKREDLPHMITSHAFLNRYEGHRIKYEYVIILLVLYKWMPDEEEFDVNNLDNPELMKAFHKMLIDLSKHYEYGANTYGENNWQKLPAKSFKDSGLRHLSQYLAGYDDEPHHVSAIWNFIGLLHVELNENNNNNKNDE